MTIRFAPARASLSNPLARHFGPVRVRVPANDTIPSPSRVASEAVMFEAVRHFGSHGLAAAREARAQAREALAAGDRRGYGWWLDICRQLDRRMAIQYERETGIPAGS